jgi:hypothetical protein
MVEPSANVATEIATELDQKCRNKVIQGRTSVGISSNKSISGAATARRTKHAHLILHLVRGGGGRSLA